MKQKQTAKINYLRETYFKKPLDKCCIGYNVVELNVKSIFFTAKLGTLNIFLCFI
jgi:hypothetical protein